jgi:protein arginine kinase activator
MLLKCNKCERQATYHITDVISEEQYQEFHLCEECYRKFYSEAQTNGTSGKPDSVQSEESEEATLLNQKECSVCGTKFIEFRNSGRLGCPQDYEEFRQELLPLLENIHGEVRHCGKTPRRLPQGMQAQSELLQLRKELQQAVTREAYEDAARLRDRIRKLEEA